MVERVGEREVSSNFRLLLQRYLFSVLFSVPLSVSHFVFVFVSVFSLTNFLKVFKIKEPTGLLGASSLSRARAMASAVDTQLAAGS